MKRILPFALSLMLAASLTLSVMAAGLTVVTTDAFDSAVRLSVADTYSTGSGLGFCFTLHADNIAKNEDTHAVKLTNATLDYQGEACRITAMGALVTHLSRIGTDSDLLNRQAAKAYTRVTDVPVKKLYRAASDYAMYAVRIVDIPFEMEEATVYARPYVEIEHGGERITLYGGIASSSYADAMASINIRLPGYGYDVDGKQRLFVGDASVLCDTMYIEIQDELDDWITTGNPSQPDKIFYACYDADGQELTCATEGYGEIILPAMSSTNATVVLEAPLAEGTAEVRIIGANIIYWTEWEI